MKNIIILMLFLASSAFASSASSSDYIFLVDNSVMVDAYYNIFNAMASIFSSDSYYDILKLAFLMGGFFVFAGGIIATIGQGSAPTSATGTVASFGKYYVASTALLVILFSVKSTMWVSTNNIPTFCTVTSPDSATTGQAIEMPSVLAFAFSSTNLLGRELTNLAEAAFSEPSSTGQTTMLDQGGFAGAVNNTMKVINLDPNKVTMKDYGVDASAAASIGLDFNTGWQIFFSKCVYEVANNKGSEGIKKITEMEKAKDLDEWVKTFLTTPFSGTTREPGESLVDIGGQTMTCQNLYDTTLVPAVALLEDNVGCGLKTVNGGTLQILTGQSNLGVSDLQGVAVQSGLIYNLSQSKKMSGIGVQSAYVSGKTLAEQNQTNLATAGYMAKVLPYVQMTMRAVLYGFFPFVFVVIILPGGLGVLKSYGQTMAWIELWGPTAAVVNMFVNLQAESEISDHYTSTGLTMISATEMMSEANTIAGVAGMLYLSIPALTWLILKGSGQMLGSFTSGMSSGFSKNLQTDSVNRDVSGIEKMNQANKSNREAGLDKVVSFGEAQHYDAKAMGMAAGGALGAQLVNGLGSVGDSSYQKSGTDLKGASFKKTALGGNDMVINSAAASELIKSDSAKKEQMLLDVLSDKGDVSLLGADDVSKTTSNEAAAKVIQSEAKQDFTGTRDNKSNLKNLNTIIGANSASNEVAIAKTITDQNLGKDLAEAVDNKSTTEAAKEIGQYVETRSEKEALGEIKDGQVDSKTIAEGRPKDGVSKAMNINKARELLDLKKVMNEDGTVNKKNFEKWSHSEAGQAYLSDKAHMASIDEIQKDMGFKTPEEAVNFKAAVLAKEDVIDTKTKHKTQKEMDDEQIAQVKSASQVQKMKEDMNEFQDLGIIDEKGNYVAEKGDKYANSEGNLGALKQVANNEMFRKLKSRTGMSDKDLVQHFGGIAGTKDLIDRMSNKVIQGGATEDELISTSAAKVLGEVANNKAQENAVKQTIGKDKATAAEMLDEALSKDTEAGRNAALKLLYKNFNSQGLESEDLTKALVASEDKMIDMKDAQFRKVVNQNKKEISALSEKNDKIKEGFKKAIPGLTDADLKKISKKSMSINEIKETLDPTGSRNLDRGKLHQLSNISKKFSETNKKIEGLKSINNSYVSANQVKEDFRGTLYNNGSLESDGKGGFRHKDTFKNLEVGGIVDTQNYIQARKGQKLEYINLKGEEWKATLDANNELLTDSVKAERGFSYTGKFNYDATFAISNATNGKYDKGLAIGKSVINGISAAGGLVTGRGLLGKFGDAVGAPSAFSKGLNTVVKGKTAKDAVQSRKTGRQSYGGF